MLSSLRSSASSRRHLAGDNNHLNSGFNVSVQVHSNVVFASVANGAVRQTNFAFRYCNARGGQCVSDVVSTDGTEQLAFIARGSGDGDFQLSQMRSALFGRSFLVGSSLFQLSTARFKCSHVGSSCSSSLALRQQVVTTVTSLNIYFIAQVAQVGDFFQQDDFHFGLSSFTFYLFPFHDLRPFFFSVDRENQTDHQQQLTDRSGYRAAVPLCKGQSAKSWKGASFRSGHALRPARRKTAAPYRSVPIRQLAFPMPASPGRQTTVPRQLPGVTARYETHDRSRPGCTTPLASTAPTPDRKSTRLN